MSKLWDDLKDNMKDWSATAVEKAEEMSKIAVAKTEEMTRISKVKFDATVDVAVRLGVDPKQANQMVRGVASLPHGTGKDVKVLALVPKDKENEAKEAGAEFVGLEEYIEKIKGGWTDVDVIDTMPSIMGKIGE